MPKKSEWINISKFDFLKYNPNVMTDRKFSDLKNSIVGFTEIIQGWDKKKGYRLPIKLVINNFNNVIIDGNHRGNALLELGQDTVHADDISHVWIESEEKEKSFVVAIRNIQGGFDDERLKDLLLEMDEENMNLAGFDDDDLQELIERLKAEEEPIKGLIDDDEVPEAEEAICKTGDLWEFGDHRLLVGNATDTHDIERLMDGSKIDLVLTDPPYGINIVRGKVGKIGGDKPFGRVAQPAGPRKAGPVKGQVIPSRIYRKVIGDDKPFDPTFLLDLAKTILIFGANNFSSKLPDKPGWLVWDKGISEKADFSSCELIWCNVGGHIKRYNFLWSGLIREGSRDDELKERVHPTQKPVGLFVNILNDYSHIGALVWDGFLGSGTTLIACEKLNRICYGMEISPEYCDVILSRYIAFVGSDEKVFLVGENGKNKHYKDVVKSRRRESKRSG